jgi:TolB-like protein
MYKKTKIVLWYVFCVLILMAGCAKEDYYFVRKDNGVNTIKKIAVLPLENLTTDEFAGEKIRRLIITELLNRDIDVVEPGEVTRVLKDMNIRSLATIKSRDLQEIGKELGADAILLGSVSAFSIVRGISVSHPEVTVNLRLVNSSKGNVIWSIHKTSGGADFWTRHFGSEGQTLSEKAEEVIKDSIKTLFNK